MDKNHEVFDDYVMKFDLNESMIRFKYNHSYRVMKECEEIAKFLEFDEEGIELAKLIGLFHDLGRFKQWTDYKTFDDSKSVDHGEFACDLLFKEGIIDELEIPENTDEVISKAIYNHNKYEYDDSDYDEVEKIFCKIVRDADKLDIFNSFADERLLELESDDINISEEVRKDFFAHKCVKNEVSSDNKNDKLIRMWSMIFDLNYDYSKNKIIKEKYIEKMYKKLDKNMFKEYYDEIINYLKEGK